MYETFSQLSIAPMPSRSSVSSTLRMYNRTGILPDQNFIEETNIRTCWNVSQNHHEKDNPEGLGMIFI